MDSITVSPAYGRDYKSAKDAKADWEAGKDFEMQSMFASGYINKADALKNGIKSVTIRYKRMAFATVVKL